ncbi:glycosyl hydrolases family 18-domain-containing protein [Lipomyces arxii]|uniref:glycosyl hydrolases family 18-domain-containing protein n=1 Tax=Lipomyces arxii TaxID=56418 RepID=UPI0034CD29DC
MFIPFISSRRAKARRLAKRCEDETSTVLWTKTSSTANASTTKIDPTHYHHHPKLVYSAPSKPTSTSRETSFLSSIQPRKSSSTISRLVTTNTPIPTATAKKYTNGIYYPEWACNINPPSSLLVKDVTHVYYTFVGLNADGSIFLTEPESAGMTGSNKLTSDACVKSFRDIRDEQQPNLKLLFSVGGGIGSANFSTVSAYADTRRVFASQLRSLVNKYSYDGIDIDWETPKDIEEGDNFQALIKTLRAYFPEGQYLLTSAFPATQWALQTIDVAKCIEQLDQFHLMAYDYYGPWNKTSGYQAQLYSLIEGGDGGSTATTYCLKNNTELANKLILGVPLYAQGFPGVNGTDQTWDRKQASADGIQVQYNQLGITANDARVIYNQSVIGASFYNKTEDIWYSFDNEQSVAAKASFVKASGLGGLFFWQGTGDMTGTANSLIGISHMLLGR